MLFFKWPKMGNCAVSSLLVFLACWLIWTDELFLFSPVDAADVSGGSTTILTYEIDRSNVPNLTYNDLTLLVNVGQAESIQVSGDGSPVSHIYDLSSGIIRFSTQANTIEISVTGQNTNASFGSFAKAELLEDKDFAWSIGMDDNVGLKPSVSIMESFGWQATFFLIASSIEDGRDEDWIIDTNYIRSKLNDGWALGNHTWDHSCDSTISRQNILDGYSRLQSIVDSSARPNYQIISFAAPCFTPEYHPVIIEQRNQQSWPVQFNESGYRTPLIVDPGISQDLYSQEEARFLAYAFDFDEPVGRATDLEVLDSQAVINQIDWMATRHDTYGEHHWHNVIVHSDKQDVINQVASYIYNTYGPGGSERIWVAPSDRIYSYLLVRDNSIVTQTGGTSNTPVATEAPTSTSIAATATLAPTSTPTSTHTATPLSQPTPTQEAEPTNPLNTETPTVPPPANTATSSITPTALPSRTATPTESTVNATPTPLQQPTSVAPSPTALPLSNPTATPTGMAPIPGQQSRPQIYIPLISESSSQPVEAH